MIKSYVKRFVKYYAPAPVLEVLSALGDRAFYRETPLRASPLTSDSSLSCLIAYNKHGGYCVPRRSIHRPALQATLRGDVWEKHTLAFIISNCGDGDIVHAGTYFGDFLPALSEACALDSKVWAFEPNKENFRCAEITKLINNLDNVELTNAGLGEKRGAAQMQTKNSNGEFRGGSSTILKEGEVEDLELTETVQTVSIDECIGTDRNVTVLQLDVEGYEKPALTGALKTIQRCLPVLVIEVLPEMDWLKANILSLGYTIEGEVQGNVILRHTE